MVDVAMPPAAAHASHWQRFEDVAFRAYSYLCIGLRAAVLTWAVLLNPLLFVATAIGLGLVALIAVVVHK